MDIKFDDLKETIRHGTYGGEIGISVSLKEDIEVLAINLKEPLVAGIKNKFNVDLNYRFFRPNVSLNERGDVVYLISSPDKGFRRLLNSLADFIEVDENPKESMPAMVYYLFDSFIVLHSALLVVLLYFTMSTT